MGHLTAAMFEQILSTGIRPNLYIETGCNVGDQLAVAASFFSAVYGIELCERFAKAAAQRLPRVCVIQGDTRDELPRLLAAMPFPVFVLVDAHFCKFDPPIPKSEFPLWDELILLRSRPYADIIVVDDVHTFGLRRDDLRFGDAAEWEGVTAASLSSFFGVPGEVVGDGYLMRRKGRS